MRWGRRFGILVMLLPLIAIVGFIGFMFLIAAIQDHYGTQYGEGFSLKAFEEVKVGMTEAQVRDLLGEPLEDKPWGRESRQLIYGRQHPDWPTASFWSVGVVVGPDGKVEEKHKQFCVD